MRAAGSLYLVFVGLLFCAVGAIFAWLMWRSYERAAGQREWTAVSCEIIESRVEERKIGAEVGTEYRFAVLYGYRFGEASHSSDQYSLRGSSWSGGRERAEALVEEFPEGTFSECFVNPAEPSVAVLKRDSQAPGYSLWFPLLIVAGGLGIVIGALRGLLRKRPAGAVAAA